MTSMTRRRGIPFLVVVVVLAVACDGGSDPEPTHSGSPAVNATTAPRLPATTDELPAVDPSGYDELMSQLRGTPVVVNVWAAWCEPCKEEAPLLVDVAMRYGKDVQFLGLDIQDSREGARRFIADFALPYPSLFDAPGEVAAELGLLGPPGTFFYDRGGKLVDSVKGLLSAEALERGILEIRG
jgi:cytochrome c biogenesis protein CcmG/thiol:disulfide interchange protein DsbE